jgi:hypothetical protein
MESSLRSARDEAIRQRDESRDEASLLKSQTVAEAKSREEAETKLRAAESAQSHADAMESSLRSARDDAIRQRDESRDEASLLMAQVAAEVKAREDAETKQRAAESAQSHTDAIESTLRSARDEAIRQRDESRDEASLLKSQTAAEVKAREDAETMQRAAESAREQARTMESSLRSARDDAIRQRDESRDEASNLMAQVAAEAKSREDAETSFQGHRQGLQRPAD